MDIATLRLLGPCSEYHDYHGFVVIVDLNPDPDPGEGRYVYYLLGDYYYNSCIYRDCLCCFFDVGQAVNAKYMFEKLLASLALCMEPDSVLDKLTEDFPDLDVRGLLAKCGYVSGEEVSAT